MAWTVPFSWTFQFVPTFTKLNEQIRDNMLVLKTSIDNNGHISWIVTTKTTTYTLVATDDIVFVTTSATMNLPASPVAGKPYFVKAAGSGVSVTVSGNGKNIDGASTFAMGPYDSYCFIYNGSEYSVF